MTECGQDGCSWAVLVDTGGQRSMCSLVSKISPAAASTPSGFQSLSLIKTKEACLS